MCLKGHQDHSYSLPSEPSLSLVSRPKPPEITATHILVAKAQDTPINRAEYDKQEYRLTNYRVDNIKYEETMTMAAKKKTLPRFVEMELGMP